MQFAGVGHGKKTELPAAHRLVNSNRKHRMTEREVPKMFWKKKNAGQNHYDRENEIPVIRSSICTGEQVAGFKDKNTGYFREIMCIRSEDRKSVV